MLRNESRFQINTAHRRRPSLLMEKAQDRQSGQGSDLFKVIPIGKPKAFNFKSNLNADILSLATLEKCVCVCVCVSLNAT